MILAFFENKVFISDNSVFKNQRLPFGKQEPAGRLERLKPGLKPEKLKNFTWTRSSFLKIIVQKWRLNSIVILMLPCLWILKI